MRSWRVASPAFRRKEPCRSGRALICTLGLGGGGASPPSALPPDETEREEEIDVEPFPFLKRVSSVSVSVSPVTFADAAAFFRARKSCTRSVLDFGAEPSRVFLYRRPILDEWAERGDVSLGDLITHVLVHEIGHHFGLSDDDIHRIEDEA